MSFLVVVVPPCPQQRHIGRPGHSPFTLRTDHVDKRGNSLVMKLWIASLHDSDVSQNATRVDQVQVVIQSTDNL